MNRSARKQNDGLTLPRPVPLHEYADTALQIRGASSEHEDFFPRNEANLDTVSSGESIRDRLILSFLFPLELRQVWKKKPPLTVGLPTRRGLRRMRGSENSHG